MINKKKVFGDYLQIRPDKFSGLIVLTGNQREFKHWLYENHMNPQHVRYVAGPSDLRGVRFDPWQIIRWGSWQLRDDIDEIEILLNIATRKL